MMLTRICSKNIVFQGGLQHKFGMSLYTKDELNKMLTEADEEEKYIGSLPASWAAKFAPNEIKEKTCEAFDLFSEFAASVYETEAKRKEHEERRLRELEFEIAALRGAYFSSSEFVKEKWKDYTKYLEEITDISCNELYKNICEDLSAKLSDLLDEKCTVKYLDDGAYGLTFQVSTKGDELVLKVYKPLETEPRHHGGIVEPANAIYLNKVMKPERCTKFYCAKVESHKKGGGFMLTKYIEPGTTYDDNKIKQINKWILNKGLSANKFHFGDIKPGDPYRGNFINGTLVDFGGVTFAYENRKEYEIMKALSLAIENEDYDRICEIEKEYGECREFQRCKKRFEAYIAGIMAYK